MGILGAVVLYETLLYELFLSGIDYVTTQENFLSWLFGYTDDTLTLGDLSTFEGLVMPVPSMYDLFPEFRGLSTLVFFEIFMLVESAALLEDLAFLLEGGVSVLLDSFLGFSGALVLVLQHAGELLFVWVFTGFVSSGST